MKSAWSIPALIDPISNAQGENKELFETYKYGVYVFVAIVGVIILHKGGSDLRSNKPVSGFTKIFLSMATFLSPYIAKEFIY